MKLISDLNNLIQRTQSDFQNFSHGESHFYHHHSATRRPPPAPGEDPDDCTALYFWVSIGVILTALLSVVAILIYFCKRNKGRSCSHDHIITSIELQSTARESPKLEDKEKETMKNHFKALRGDNIKITIVERY